MFLFSNVRLRVCWQMQAMYAKQNTINQQPNRDFISWVVYKYTEEPEHLRPTECSRKILLEADINSPKIECRSLPACAGVKRDNARIDCLHKHIRVTSSRPKM